MSKRTWLWGGLAAALVAGLGLGGVQAVRAAEPPAGDAGDALLPPELGNRPLGRVLRGALPKLRRLHQDLDLTDAQRKAVRGVLEAHREEIGATVRKLRDSHRQVTAASRAEPFDEAAIRAAASGMAGSLADAAVLKAKVQREIAAHLTAEQVAKVEAFHDELEATVDQAIERRGAEQ